MMAAAVEFQQPQQQHGVDDSNQQQQQQPYLAIVDVDNSSGGITSNSKAPRLPRWTRQEILVLIQGKQVAESRVRRGRTGGGGGLSGSGVEPKWATVSTYCKRHGVNRGAVQCRKRWSNLAGDFKKIKEWEKSCKDDNDSFWVMRNDLRRERKLPGFFDKEVFDILDGNNLSIPTINSNSEMTPDSEPRGGGGGDLDLDDDDDFNDDNNDHDDVATPQHVQLVETATTTIGTSTSTGATRPVLFDSCRSAAADDALFSDLEQHNNTNSIPIAIPAPIPISAKQYEAEPPHHPPAPPTNHPGIGAKKAAAAADQIGSTSQVQGAERKRRRIAVEDNNVQADNDTNDDLLIQVLDKNAKLISAQLEAHDNNLKLDREERKDHSTNIIAVLNKLADALSTIANKL